jgi:addiction module RelB/DinJ family antitoxin
MAQTSLVQVRVDTELKHQAEALFADIGLDISTAVKLFFKQAVSRQELPFPLVRKAPRAWDSPDSLMNNPLHAENFRKFSRDELYEDRIGPLVNKAEGLLPGMAHPVHVENHRKYTREELHER